MNKTQIIELLKKLQKFDMETDCGFGQSYSYMEENKFGDYVKFEDICKLFEIEVDAFNVIKE